MGFYERHIGPRIVGCLCCMQKVMDERRKVVPDASGVVLEIGIGPGLNLPLYQPGRVERVVGVDPIEGFLKLGRERVQASPVPVQILHAPAEDIPVADASIDTAVVTYTLCSVQDPVRSLREVRRVLKPQGRVLFLEHGLSDDASVVRWQNALNPLWKRFAVGCNLNRPVVALLQAAGLRIEQLSQFCLAGTPRAIGSNFAGIARPA